MIRTVFTHMISLFDNTSAKNLSTEKGYSVMKEHKGNYYTRETIKKAFYDDLFLPLIFFDLG